MKTSTPRVVHLSGRSFWCGESNRVLVICRGLYAKGWPVMLGVPPDSPLAARASEEGIPVDTRFRFRRGFRPFTIMRDVLALRRMHREMPIDILHLHTSVDTWIAALAFGFSKRPPYPLIVRTRHSDHVSKGDMIHRWLYRHTIDHVVLSSDSLRTPLAALFRTGALTDARVSVIHSSIDVARFDPETVSGHSIREELGLDDRICIGLIGRVSSEKGHDLLVRVLPEIVNVEPRVMCVFVGEGDQEAHLREQTGRLNLQQHVYFTGFRSDIPEIVAAMDLLVVPSTRVESSPAVVKEAMAMRKPVVAADVGGVGEIISHGEDGLVIPPHDAVALRDAVLQLLQDADLRQRLVMHARARVVSSFSDACLVANTMRMYMRLKEQS